MHERRRPLHTRTFSRLRMVSKYDCRQHTQQTASAQQSGHERAVQAA